MIDNLDLEFVVRILQYVEEVERDSVVEDSRGLGRDFLENGVANVRCPDAAKLMPAIFDLDQTFLHASFDLALQCL